MKGAKWVWLQAWAPSLSFGRAPIRNVDMRKGLRVRDIFQSTAVTSEEVKKKNTVRLPVTCREDLKNKIRVPKGKKG